MDATDLDLYLNEVTLFWDDVRAALARMDFDQLSGVGEDITCLYWTLLMSTGIVVWADLCAATSLPVSVVRPWVCALVGRDE